MPGIVHRAAVSHGSLQLVCGAAHSAKQAPNMLQQKLGETVSSNASSDARRLFACAAGQCKDAVQLFSANSGGTAVQIGGIATYDDNDSVTVSSDQWLNRATKHISRC